MSYIRSHFMFRHLRTTTNLANDQPPVGLIAHYPGIAEIMGSNPVQALTFFFRLFLFQQLKVISLTARVIIISYFIRSSHI